jgi:hypothetical protein
MLQELEVAEQVFKVERQGETLDVILYRGWLDNGEHSEEYCVELQFKNKKTAQSWLKRHKLKYREIEDHQELSWR